MKTELPPQAIAQQARKALEVLEKDEWWTGGIAHLRHTLANFPGTAKEFREFCTWFAGAEQHIKSCIDPTYTTLEELP